MVVFWGGADGAGQRDRHIARLHLRADRPLAAPVIGEGDETLGEREGAGEA